MRASCSGAAVGTLAIREGHVLAKRTMDISSISPAAETNSIGAYRRLLHAITANTAAPDEQPREDHDVGNPDDEVARAGRPLLALPVLRHEDVRPREDDLVAGDPDVDARLALRQRGNGRVGEGERPVGSRLQLRGTRRHFPDLSAASVEAEPLGDGLDGERPRVAARRATRRRDLPARRGGRAARGRLPTTSTPHSSARSATSPSNVATRTDQPGAGR